MGNPLYEVDQRYRLEWPEGSPFHGMEVVMTSMGIATLFRIDEITGAIRRSSDRDELRELWRERASIIVEHGIEWNLARKDAPLPFDVDSVMSLEPKQLTAIVDGWVQAVSEVPDPLRARSDDGEQPPAESIPMEAL